jgi:hypothetical protein
MVRGDDLIPIGQQRDQVAEHKRAGWKTVQEHNDWRVGRPRLPVKQPPAVHGGIAMVDGCHFCSIPGRPRSAAGSLKAVRTTGA